MGSFRDDGNRGASVVKFVNKEEVLFREHLASQPDVVVCRIILTL